MRASCERSIERQCSRPPQLAVSSSIAECRTSNCSRPKIGTHSNCLNVFKQFLRLRLRLRAPTPQARYYGPPMPPCFSGSSAEV